MPGKKKIEGESTAPKKPKKPAAAKVVRKTSTRLKKTETSKPSGAKPNKKAVIRTKALPSETLIGSIRKKGKRQGETQMVAFIRDPQCIFTYWEVTPEKIEAVKEQLMDEYKNSSMVLRVFKTGPKGETELIQEISVEPGEMNRYVELKDRDGSYFIEIAQKTPSGRVVVYARSNKITTGISSETPVRSSASPGSKWDPPEGLLEYFSDEDETEPSIAISGISSAEAYRRDSQKKKFDRYSASRIN